MVLRKSRKQSNFQKNLDFKVSEFNENVGKRQKSGKLSSVIGNNLLQVISDYYHFLLKYTFYMLRIVFVESSTFLTILDDFKMILNEMSRSSII